MSAIGYPPQSYLVKLHFPLISENEFTHEIKRDGMTSFHGFHVLLFMEAVELAWAGWLCVIAIRTGSPNGIPLFGRPGAVLGWEHASLPHAYTQPC